MRPVGRVSSGSFGACTWHGYGSSYEQCNEVISNLDISSWSFLSIIAAGNHKDISFCSLQVIDIAVEKDLQNK